jgi:exopolysaccharide biosynthesis polyprenyl glycosylphosphotransferase
VGAPGDQATGGNVGALRPAQRPIIGLETGERRLDTSSVPAAGFDATVRQPTGGRHARPETPAQRSGDGAADHPVSPAVVSLVPPQRTTGSVSTLVLPYVSSPAAKRTRRLRAWMLTAPVDLVALLVPIAFGTPYWRGTVSAALVTLIFFAAGGLYRPRRHLSILDELPSLCGRLLAAAAIVAIIAAVRHDSVMYGTDFMRGVAISAGSVIVGRTLIRQLTILARRRRWVEHSALIIGSGPIGVELGRLLRRYPQYGLRFAGYIDAQSRVDGPLAPLVGTLDGLPEMIALTECDVLIVADPDCEELALMEIMRQPGSRSCDLWVVPRLWGSRSHGGMADHIGAIPVVQIGNTVLSGPRWAMKRLSDVLFASIALIMLSPLLLLCALATRLSGGPGIFFMQERIGRDGKPIKVIKFRTMRPRDENESRTNWSIANDQRVTRVGRFMRRTSLDELPQLWNIVRGDMTVVGPRPERPYFVEKFSAEFPEYAMRHRVPVGLTGLAQVSGLRGDTPISDRARFDNYYIENWSLWLDTKVVLRTIREVFRGGGR